MTKTGKSSAYWNDSTDKAGPNAVAGGSSEEAGTSQGEEQGVKCSLCGVVVEAEKFSEHLSDYHAEERCDTCGARVQGAVGLLQHIESNHYGALLAPRASTSKNPLPSPCPSPSPRLAPPPQHLPSPLPAPVSPSPCHSPAIQPSPPPLRPTPSLWPSPSPRPTPFLQPSPSPHHSPAPQPLPPPRPTPSSRPSPSTHHSPASQPSPPPPRPTPSPRPMPSPLPMPSPGPCPSPHHSPAPQPLPPPRPTPSSRPSPSPHYSPAPQPSPPCRSPSPQPTPSSCPAPSLPTPPLPQAATDWESFLPSQFKRVLQPADWVWVAKCLYEPTGQLRQKIQENWFHPPMLPKPSPPEPGWYFRQRMFLWAPMRMWGIPLNCSQCGRKMHHSGIYPKVREVIDVDSRYYLVGGDYPRCSVCRLPVCPWSQDILSQLDVAHRSLFPAVLTTQLALDRKCVTFLRPRTSGNSSSYLQSAIEEVHSEEWARRTIQYLSDCENYSRKVALVQPATAPSFSAPAPFRPLPLAQWFETVHSNDILSHRDEMKGVITSTYGRILKMDSTKKVQ
ncbi:hypothetical protein ABG768_003361 [Culter alburnus]|uniref:C2H2-type domain-containing protein n=1 Tax=Culter alburnus TaxID=194366 RepID=A0AAW1ZZK1_CULAL